MATTTATTIAQDAQRTTRWAVLSGRCGSPFFGPGAENARASSASVRSSTSPSALRDHRAGERQHAADPPDRPALRVEAPGPLRVDDFPGPLDHPRHGPHGRADDELPPPAKAAPLEVRQEVDRWPS